MTRTNSNCIKARNSTIIYEISKSLGKLTLSKDYISDEDIELKNNILNNNSICEYCEKNKATTNDHLYPFVKDKMPTDACDDYWNIIPCCTSCNSSKGGSLFNDWIKKHILINLIKI